ncbi:MAG TPA: hypothetical protein VGV35_13395 [Bryobacteraceae bacterium]|nr:hypothetical protein [Bryobacteraceae bacterium]
MRYAAGKVLILLTIALALVNARCFSKCLVELCCQKGTMPCHSQGKSTSADCSHHHDLTAPEASASPAADAVCMLALIPVSIELEASPDAVAATSPSPPRNKLTTHLLPLRV